MRAGMGRPLAHADRASTPVCLGCGATVAGLFIGPAGPQMGPGRRATRLPVDVAQPPRTKRVPPRKSRRVGEWLMELGILKESKGKGAPEAIHRLVTGPDWSIRVISGGDLLVLGRICADTRSKCLIHRKRDCPNLPTRQFGLTNSVDADDFCGGACQEHLIGGKYLR